MFEFLRGLLMDEAGIGDGGGGVAVADASSDFGGGAEPVGGAEPSSEVHDAEFVDPENAPIAETVREESTALVKAGERAVQNGKFTPSGRAAIEAVKALSPKLGQEVIQSLMVSDYYRQQFPGGKKEVAQLRQLAEQHGGEQGISELKFKSSELDRIDSLYEAGDPQFIEQITETPEGQAGFVKLMLPALQKFEKLSPQQFNYHRMKDFVHFMDTARLPVTFARMADLLNRATSYQKAGNNELAASLLSEVTASYNEIADTLDKVYTAAKNPPAANAPVANPQLDERTRTLTQREQAVQKQEWEGSVRDERKRVFGKAWLDQTKGRTLTGEQDANIKGFYELRLTSKVRQWQNQAARFFSNGDKDGYLKEQYAFFQKAIPEALRQAIAQAVPAKPGPKPAGGPLKPSVRGAAPSGGTQSVTRVNKFPNFGDWDTSKTTSELLSQNRYYGKDGRLYEVRA